MTVYSSSITEFARFKQSYGALEPDSSVVTPELNETIKAIAPEPDSTSVTQFLSNNLDDLIENKGPLIEERNNILDNPFYFFSIHQRKRLKEIDERLRAISRQMYRVNNEADELLDIALTLKHSQSIVERYIRRFGSIG